MERRVNDGGKALKPHYLCRRGKPPRLVREVESSPDLPTVPRAQKQASTPDALGELSDSDGPPKKFRLPVGQRWSPVTGAVEDDPEYLQRRHKQSLEEIEREEQEAREEAPCQKAVVKPREQPMRTPVAKKVRDTTRRRQTKATSSSKGKKTAKKAMLPSSSYGSHLPSEELHLLEEGPPKKALSQDGPWAAFGFAGLDTTISASEAFRLGGELSAEMIDEEEAGAADASDDDPILLRPSPSSPQRLEPTPSPLPPLPRFGREQEGSEAYPIEIMSSSRPAEIVASSWSWAPTPP